MEFLGIQIDRPYLRAALIQKTRKKIEIRSLKSVLLSEPEDVKQLYKENFKGKISTGLSPNDFLIRSLELKIPDRRHIEKVIAFQSEATSHLKPGEVLTVPIFMNEQKKGTTKALLFTAARDSLKRHLSELEKIDVDPDRISSICSALCRFIHWKIPSLSDAYIIDLGSSEWTCAWMEGGSLKKSHSILGGTEALLAALWEDRKKILLQKEIDGIAKQIDLMQLKSHLNPHLSEKLNQLRQELAKAVYSFHRSAEVRPVIFTGRTDAFGHLTEFLTETFRDAVLLEPKTFLSLDDQKYAVCLGLAMELSSSSSLQFRRQEFFPKKNWRRLGLYALVLFSLSLSLSLTLYQLANYGRNSRKSEMVESLQFSLDRWDPSLKKKMIKGKEEEILGRWIQMVESHNKEYSYIPQAPKVSEVLSWLSKHPLVETLKREGDPLIIREFRYQLVQFPKIGSVQEPYLGKVELEFQVNGAMHARKFHEALLKGDDQVNPHLEITWESLSDSYRTSFFLKNRTPHVP